MAARGGVAAHGGVAARGGARTRSDQIRRVPDRPSVSEPAESIWSSMGVIDQTMPSTSRGHESNFSMPAGPEVEHSSKKSDRPLNCPLRDEEIISLLNYGSEEDSDSESEGMARPMISRVERMRMQETYGELETPAINLPANSAPTPDLPTTVPMEPNNKFNFDWRAFPEPQIEPRLRRETFSQINSGPKVSFTSPKRSLPYGIGILLI